jgi:hypothetical protein
VPLTIILFKASYISFNRLNLVFSVEEFNLQLLYIFVLIEYYFLCHVGKVVYIRSSKILENKGQVFVPCLGHGFDNSEF